MNSKTATSVQNYINIIFELTSCWSIRATPWFRGLKKIENKDDLLPNLYRKDYSENENKLIQLFRNYAYNFGEVPEFSRIDQWLFLMQHCGVPTRLLDWSENSLAALYFAIFDKNDTDECKVYILNPVFLNFISQGIFNFNLSWVGYKAPKPVIIGNICAAFERDRIDIQSNLPQAIYPQPVHKRITSQKGTFTVHGYDKRGIEKQFIDFDVSKYLSTIDDRILSEVKEMYGFSSVCEFKEKMISDFCENKYLAEIKIDCKDYNEWLLDLSKLGVTNSVLFPDFDGLANELKQMINKNIR